MPKNIVVCYDGTGNEYGPHNTNVVGTFQAVLRDEERQVAFYDPGVGTFSALGRLLGRRLGILLGKAFGYGLVENIEDGYRYLMDHYREGDRVFVFGFSRGAFQARCLAAYLNKVGVLESGSRNLVPYATRIAFGQDNRETAEGFKATYCRDCPVHFVGVWDTVASLGYFFGKRFSNNVLHPSTRYGCQAVAIDEARAKFPVSLWNEQDLPREQTIEQVWFAGVHSDVGGWYDERGLSDLAAEWMLEKAESAGLRLRPDWRTRLRPDPLDRLHDSRVGFWRLWRPVVRRIPEGATLHWSVEERMNAPGHSYRPPLPQSYRWSPRPPAERA